MNHLRMNCPACDHHLSEQRVGSAVVDICSGGCGGIWFDAHELKRVDDPHEVEAAKLERIQAVPGVVADSSRRRKCPRCENQIMLRRWFSRKREVEIDECPACGGCWLDAGELTKIRQEVMETGGHHTARLHISRLVYQYASQIRSAE